MKKSLHIIVATEIDSIAANDNDYIIKVAIMAALDGFISLMTFNNDVGKVVCFFKEAPPEKNSTEYKEIEACISRLLNNTYEIESLFGVNVLETKNFILNIQFNVVRGNGCIISF